MGNDNCIQNCDRKPEGKRPDGRPRRRWEDNIKMNLRKVAWEGVDWIHLAENRDQWRAFYHGKESSGSMKGVKFLDYLSDY
jgi:hypothetical protein